MRKIFTTVAFVFVACSLFITSCSKPEKQKILDKILTEKTIVVGTTGEQFPFTFKEGDELKGIDISIAHYLGKELGVDVKFEIMDFDQLIPAVENGTVDIVFSGVSITTERNTKVAFPGVYFKSGKSILTKNKTLSKGKDEFVNKASVTLVTTKGTTSEEFVKNRFPKAKLVLVDSNSDAIALLGADKVDGIVADFETCESLAFSYEESFLFYNNISKSTEKEFISPVVASGDNLYINLIANYIKRINAVDKSEAVDRIWYKYAN